MEETHSKWQDQYQAPTSVHCILHHPKYFYSQNVQSMWTSHDFPFQKAGYHYNW